MLIGIRIVLAIGIVFLVPSLTCTAMMTFQSEAFDWMCGHNVYLQWFLLIAPSYILVGMIPVFRKHKPADPT